MASPSHVPEEIQAVRDIMMKCLASPSIPPREFYALVSSHTVFSKARFMYESLLQAKQNPQRHNPPEVAEYLALEDARRWWLAELPLEVRRMIMMERIARTEKPVFINLTRNSPAGRVEPFTALENGVPFFALHNFLGKIYGPEVVDVVVKRIQANGTNKIYKLLFSQSNGGPWRISVVESTHAELEAHLAAKKRR